MAFDAKRHNLKQKNKKRKKTYESIEPQRENNDNPDGCAGRKSA